MTGHLIATLACSLIASVRGLTVPTALIITLTPALHSGVLHRLIQAVMLGWMRRQWP